MGRAPFANMTANQGEIYNWNNRKSLQVVEEDCAPLINQLKEKKTPAQMIEQLDEVVSCAAEREYMEAGKAYTLMTMGKKKWNNCHANYAGTHCQNKGVRVYHTHQSDLLDYDKNPVVQKYCQSVRRLVMFAQTMWP